MDLNLITVPEQYSHMRLVEFDYEVYKNNPDSIVCTIDGREVKQLTEFDIKESYRLYGVLESRLEIWTLEGKFCRTEWRFEDLILYLPKPCPRYNADIQIAYALGYDIEYRAYKDDEWKSYSRDISFTLENPKVIFRVKPNQGYVPLDWHTKY